MTAIVALILALASQAAGGGQIQTQTQTQTPQTFGARQPPRDVASEKKGTAVIRGRITNSEGLGVLCQRC